MSINSVTQRAGVEYDARAHSIFIYNHWADSALVTEPGTVDQGANTHCLSIVLNYIKPKDKNTPADERRCFWFIASIQKTAKEKP